MLEYQLSHKVECKVSHTQFHNRICSATNWRRSCGVFAAQIVKHHFDISHGVRWGKGILYACLCEFRIGMLGQRRTLPQPHRSCWRYVSRNGCMQIQLQTCREYPSFSNRRVDIAICLGSTGSDYCLLSARTLLILGNNEPCLITKINRDEFGGTLCDWTQALG